ncbi:MAG: metallophosphoesterase [Cytophagaceae bacterium]
MRRSISLTIITLLLLTVGVSSCRKSLNTDDQGEYMPLRNNLNFLVVGDWGRDGEYHQFDVATQMSLVASQLKPDFIISTGDNFYPIGVSDIHDPQWNTSFENIYRHRPLQIEWYPVLGNHDYMDNPDAEIEYSAHSRRWRLPARYHTVVKDINGQASARFIFIDSSPFIKSYHRDYTRYSDLIEQDTSRQLRWLDSVLVNSQEKWKFVIGHHMIYSYGGHHGNQKDMMEQIKPRLIKHGVDVYFAGHEHDLQHLAAPEESSVQYVVSGGGSQLRPTVGGPETIYGEMVNGFNAVSLSADSLKVLYVDKTGDIRHKFVIKK